MLLLLLLTVCVFTSTWWKVHMERSEVSTMELVLPFHLYVGSEDWVARFPQRSQGVMACTKGFTCRRWISSLILVQDEVIWCHHSVIFLNSDKQPGRRVCGFHKVFIKIKLTEASWDPLPPTPPQFSIQGTGRRKLAGTNHFSRETKENRATALLGSRSHPLSSEGWAFGVEYSVGHSLPVSRKGRVMASGPVTERDIKYLVLLRFSW